MKKERTPMIMLSSPIPGSNFIELKAGSGEAKFKKFKSRINFRFYSKENVDDFIETLKEYSDIAFRKGEENE